MFLAIAVSALTIAVSVLAFAALRVASAMRDSAAVFSEADDDHRGGGATTEGPRTLGSR